MTRYYAPSYWTGKYERPYERRRAAVVERLYAAVPFADDWTAVDLGAGSGFYARLLKRRAGAVIAVDVDAEVLAPLARDGIGTLTGDLDAALPLSDQSADFVNCLDVLEHLHRPLALLDEIRRVLKPGGFALISTQNRGSLEGYKGRAWAWWRGRAWKAWDETHRYIFSFGELVGETGRRFTILEKGGYYYGVFSFRNRHVPPALWRLYCRRPLLRALGFTTMLLVRRAS
jgi:SAM-dependent methyltransferase